MTTRPLKIVLVTLSDLPQGGGNTLRLARLVDALGRLGHRLVIWNQHALGVSPAEGLTPSGKIGGAPFVYALGKTARQSGFASIADKIAAVKKMGDWLARAHAENAVDVLWLNNLSCYDQYPLSRLAARLGIPTVQSYEDERLELVSSGAKSLSRKLFALNSRLADRYCPPLADAVVVISHYLQEKYAALVREPKRVVIVPTIIDCAAWDAGAEKYPAVPVLLYAGAFGEQDEIENLLAAFAILRDEDRAFRVVMLGGNVRDPEPLKNAQRLTQTLRLTDRVSFPGFVPNAEVQRQISAANILLNIRRDGVWSSSGLSTKLSEYLASGRLVISSEVGEVRHYLSDEKNALLVSAQCTAPEIAQKIRQGLDSPERRRTIGRAGREVALVHFDLPVVMRTLGLMLEKIKG